MRRKLSGLYVAALWLALTIAGEIAVSYARIFPRGYAHEAKVADDAFVLLMRMSVPVGAFVMAMLVYSLVFFRSHRRQPAGAGSDGDTTGEPDESEFGAPIRGNRDAYAIWMVVTSALTVLIIINPGLSGLAEMRGKPYEDMVVEVEGARWVWRVNFPDAGASSSGELVLPVHKRIRFDVTSKDILHSFWIPGFRVKIDAVPGRTTQVWVTTEETGSYNEDFNLRIQCAELCGLNHTTMMMPVRVVEQGEFDSWLEAARKATEAAESITCSAESPQLRITAANIAFDKKCLAARAGTAFSIELVNNDGAIPHNLSIAKDRDFKDNLYVGRNVPGSATDVYEVEPITAGRYYFRCDLHPIPAMSGVFVSEGS